MSDLIRVVDLEVWTHIGVPDKERAQSQRLLISLDLTVDCISQAAAADDVACTVNYYDVVQRVKALAGSKPRKLLETLAEEIAFDLLKNFSIMKLVVEIKKFILTETRHVAVKIERCR